MLGLGLIWGTVGTPFIFAHIYDRLEKYGKADGWYFTWCYGLAILIAVIIATPFAFGIPYLAGRMA